MPLASVASASVLKQNTVGQAEVVAEITKFRVRHAADPSVPRWESRESAPGAYERLVEAVEWALIENPLPRLQLMGQSERRVIYEICWDTRVRKGEVTGYQRGAGGAFDNRVMLRPGVGEYLLQLSGLLRPLIQRRWAAMVAQLNRLEESQLELFLSGRIGRRPPRSGPGYGRSKGGAASIAMRELRSRCAARWITYSPTGVSMSLVRSTCDFQKTPDSGFAARSSFRRIP